MADKIQEKNYSKWAIGDIDNHGNKINHIYTAVDEFIIYSSDSGTLHYDDNGTQDFTKKLSSLSKESSIISTLKNEKDLTLINNIVATAWRDCFNNDTEMAKAILNNLINQLISNGKKIYILSLMFTFLGVLIICLLMIHILSFHSFNSELILINKISILGAFGGLISVLIKMRDLVLDPQSQTINIYSGISRIIIAVAASLIFYLGYQSEIIFTFAKNNIQDDKGIYFVLLISFFMGFSERAIPDFSNKINDLISNK
jgi:hypothetical protein